MKKLVGVLMQISRMILNISTVEGFSLEAPDAILNRLGSMTDPNDKSLFSASL
jgi:hypothetical protein